MDIGASSSKKGKEKAQNSQKRGLPSDDEGSDKASKKLKLDKPRAVSREIGFSDRLRTRDFEYETTLQQDPSSAQKLKSTNAGPSDEPWPNLRSAAAIEEFVAPIEPTVAIEDYVMNWRRKWEYKPEDAYRGSTFIPGISADAVREEMEQYHDVRYIHLQKCRQTSLTEYENAYYRMSRCKDEIFTDRGDFLPIREIENDQARITYEVFWYRLRFDSDWNLLDRDGTGLAITDHVDYYLFDHRDDAEFGFLTTEYVIQLSRTRTAIACAGITYLEKELKDLERHLRVAERWIRFSLESKWSRLRRYADREGYCSDKYLRARTINEIQEYSLRITQTKTRLEEQESVLNNMIALESKALRRIEREQK